MPYPPGNRAFVRRQKGSPQDMTFVHIIEKNGEVHDARVNACSYHLAVRRFPVMGSPVLWAMKLAGNRSAESGSDAVAVLLPSITAVDPSL